MTDVGGVYDEAGIVDTDGVASDAYGDSVEGVSAAGGAYSDEQESVEVVADGSVACDDAVVAGFVSSVCGAAVDVAIAVDDDDDCDGSERTDAVADGSAVDQTDLYCVALDERACILVLEDKIPLNNSYT